MIFLRNFLILIILFILLILGLGFRSNGYFQEDYSVNLTFRTSFLYDIISNPLIYSKIKFGLKNIDVLEEQDRNKIWKWRENYHFGLFKYQKEIQLNSYQNQKFYEIEILKNSLGYTGNIKYNLEYDENTGTILNIKTNLFVENLFLRGLYVLRGKNVFSAGEVKWIRVGIGKKLLERI